MISIGRTWLLALLLAQTNPGGMHSQLASEDPSALANAARTEGDPVRGALVFHAPQLLCAKCHTNGETTNTLGPDLSRIGKDVTDLHLIESILSPSKMIKKEYATITITTKSGKTVTGLLVSDRDGNVVVRGSNPDEPLITIRGDEIEERKVGGASLMPVGLVDGLNSRQQFLDLVRYLREIADKGPRRVELRPRLRCWSCRSPRMKRTSITPA